MGILPALLAGHVERSYLRTSQLDAAAATGTAKISQTLGKPAHHGPGKRSHGNETQENALPGKRVIPSGHDNQPGEQRDGEVDSRKMPTTDSFADQLSFFLKLPVGHEDELLRKSILIHRSSQRGSCRRPHQNFSRLAAPETRANIANSNAGTWTKSSRAVDSSL